MWDDAKALNALAATLAVMAAIALVASLVAWGARQGAFEFREVVVTTPLQRASAPHLEAVIRDELAGTFFSMNLDAARAAIAGVPWVRSASLRRQWPHRLEVAIEEHEPLARWGDAALVNTFGETFVARHAGRLPRFDGPDGYAADMAARYAEWRAVLAPLSLELAGLEVSPRGGWRVRTLRDGASLVLDLGHDDPGGRLVRFAGAYARTIATLQREGTTIEHVDLRYRNGFAARVPTFREGATRKPPATRVANAAPARGVQ
jgi:cell division protein FtsQ